MVALHLFRPNQARQHLIDWLLVLIGALLAWRFWPPSHPWGP